MSNPQVVPGIPGFSRHGSATFIYHPTTSAPQLKSSAPDLILLPVWMDAQYRHVTKYTAGYQVLYPHASIVVIFTTAADFIWRSKATNVDRIAPVLKALYDLPPNANILLHCFSNGGGSTMCLIASEYASHKGHAIPAHALVIDSAPGTAELLSAVAAFKAGLPPNPIFQALGTVFLFVFLTSYMLVHKALGKKDALTTLRDNLLDKTIFPQDAKRLYIYSKEDKMVSYGAVERHAASSREAGYSTRTELFPGTSHAAHLMGDPKRYWGAVQGTWNEE